MRQTAAFPFAHARQVWPRRAVVCVQEQGTSAIARALSSERAFDSLRATMPATLARWSSARQPIQAVLLLEIAQYTLTHSYFYWVDALDLSRRFVMSRPEPPGVNRRDDEFELVWHKASFALLSLSRRPELIENCGIQPISSRITATVSDRPTLVDPWIELASGISDEFWTIFDADDLSSKRPVAVYHFEQAAFPVQRPRRTCGRPVC